MDHIVLTIICTGCAGEIHEQILAEAGPVCKRKLPAAEIPTHFYAVSMRSPGICDILYCISEKNLLCYFPVKMLITVNDTGDIAVLQKSVASVKTYLEE